jgi:hypothetical protein
MSVAEVVEIKSEDKLLRKLRQTRNEGNDRVRDQLSG